MIKEEIKKSCKAVTALPRDDLRKFMSKLLKIVKESKGRIKDEAMLCLAEIGPVDLVSEVLEEDSDAGQDLMATLLRQLVEILQSSSGDLATRTTQTLINILSYTGEGRDWLLSMDDGGRQDLRSFLVPFKRTKTTTRKSSGFSQGRFSQRVDQEEVWEGIYRSHSEWLTSLVIAMLGSYGEGSVFRFLMETCQVSLSLCEAVFPFLVTDLLTKSSDDIRLALSIRFCKFFEDHHEKWTEVSGGSIEAEEEFPYLRPESIRMMVAAVLHLRQRTLSDNSWQENFKLTNINYLHCASAALTCGEHFSALLMCQVSVDILRGSDC